MSVTLPRAILTLSIDLELDPQRRVLNQQRYLEDATVMLLSAFGRWKVPATWGVADPAISVVTERLAADPANHEIAILGDATWVGREAGRSRFVREIARRTTRGRSASLAISTLLLRSTSLDEHVDIAARHGITCGCEAVEENPSSLWPARGPKVEALRYGVWSIPAGLRLPGISRWLPSGGGVHLVRGAIDRAIKKTGVCHVRIDSLGLATRGPAALRALDRMLRHADRRRQQGLLAIETVAETARQLSGVRRGVPARSILRPAA